MHRLVIDTDLGVDDAAAIAWLLAREGDRVDLAGISTTWGNTTASNAAANTIALLRAAGRADVPIAVGADVPVGRSRSRVGALAHGEDGLWGSAPPGAVGAVTRDVLELYREVAAPGSTLVALGPLTNLARVVREDIAVLRRFERIVILGGAKHGGTMTPVSETNFWHDPEAADVVLSARLPITLVTKDAHRHCQLSSEDLTALAEAGPVMRFLAAPVAKYIGVTRRFGEAATLPDVVAAIVAVDPSVVTVAEQANVRVIAGDGLARGQSVIGISVNERLTMVDDGAALQQLIDAALDDPAMSLQRGLASIVERAPATTTVVLEVDAARVRSLFIGAFAAARGAPPS